MNNTVTPKWLYTHLFDKDLVILELCQSNNKLGLKSKIQGSIIGSIPVDIKTYFADPNGTFPNTFPSVNQFEASCNSLSITNESKVIIVDRLGVYSSPRLWFIFKAMGHKDVAILDGGLPEWKDIGYEVVSIQTEISSTYSYTATPIPEMIKYIFDIKENCDSQRSILIDARSSDRYLSLVQEPRTGIRSGKIPNSINIPFMKLLNGHKYKSLIELRSIFLAYKLNDKPLIFSCGSGVTACIVMLAAELVNDNPKSIYDGSWTEYASLTKT